MNWTNEMEQFKKVSDNLSNTGVSAEKECRDFCEKEESSFLERQNGDYIEEYGFSDVTELEYILDKHWNKYGINCLESYKQLICISAFKNRDIHKNKGNISEFIYEF